MVSVLEQALSILTCRDPHRVESRGQLLLNHIHNACMHRLPSVCLVRLVVITFKLDYLSSTFYSACRHLFFNIWLTLWFWAVTWDLEAVIAVPVQVADAMTCDGAMRIVIRCKNYYVHGSACTIMAIESCCDVATQ